MEEYTGARIFGGNAVRVHVYDVSGNPVVTATNRVLSVMGTGAFHAAVEIYGWEWSYGGCSRGTGVFHCPPKECEAHKYKETIEMGETRMSEAEFRRLIERLAREWPGADYDLLRHNCCNFSNTLCQELGVGHLPVRIMSLATGVDSVVTDGKAARGAAADEGYAFGDFTRGLLMKARKEVEITKNVGKEARGAERQDGYRFGDFTRGLDRRTSQEGSAGSGRKSSGLGGSATALGGGI